MHRHPALALCQRLESPGTNVLKNRSCVEYSLGCTWEARRAKPSLQVRAPLQLPLVVARALGSGCTRAPSYAALSTYLIGVWPDQQGSRHTNGPCIALRLERW